MRRSALIQPARRGNDPVKVITPVQDDLNRLIHNLEVHQVELQSQNDELISAQQELQKAHDRYTDLYNHAPMAYFTIDLPNNRIVDVNYTAALMLKITRNAVLKKRFAQFIEPEFSDIFHHCIKQTFNTPYKAICEIKMHTGDGAVFWAELDILGRAEDKQVRIAVLNIDERKKGEEIKDEFISMVSHEVKTPLTVLIGALSILKSEELLPEQKNDLVDSAFSSAHDMAAIVENMLELSRFQSKRMVINIQQINIMEIIDRVTQKLRSKSEKHTIVTKFSPKIPPVAVDAFRIERILYNLVDNAIKYSPEGGTVEVFARPEKSRLIVGVSDEGPGIAPEDRLRLFQSFERINPSDHYKISGLGLGLKVCRVLVEAHGGNIWVEPGPEKGSVFLFSLPLRAGK
jgi:PAS domain S-box-containing protein